MSDESTPIISPEKQPVVIVVTFVLALLAFVLTVYNSIQIRNTAEFYGLVAIRQANKTAQGGDTGAADQMAKLEARIAKLEAAPAAAAPEEKAEGGAE